MEYYLIDTLRNALIREKNKCIYFIIHCWWSEKKGEHIFEYHCKKDGYNLDLLNDKSEFVKCLKCNCRRQNLLTQYGVYGVIDRK